MKLYTEEQMSIAINVAKANPEQSYLILSMLIPVQLPSNEEILKEANCFYGLESYNTTFAQGAKYVIDKIKGGDFDTFKKEIKGGNK